MVINDIHISIYIFYKKQGLHLLLITFEIPSLKFVASSLGVFDIVF